MLAACFAAAISGTAYAAVSQQEADQLGGTTLTEFGAEKVGNADGSIPPYTGGLPKDTAPAGWKPGTGRYDKNPFDDEKPLLSVNAGNMDKYADRLTAGAVAMMKKYPDYRIDVYPSHRSQGYPAEWLSHCKTNATTVKMTKTGNGVEGGHSCVAFPIPKDGNEVQWNNATRYVYGVDVEISMSNWLMDAAQHVTDLGHITYTQSNYWTDPATNTTPGYRLGISQGAWKGPPFQVGTLVRQTRSLDYDKQSTLAWFYSPGQRRVRLAPEFAFDTPIASYGGAITYDEQFGFGGSPERFDWKLVGKKEMYVPYNDYKLFFTPVDKLFSKGFVNPDNFRFELHRVWVIESTLKPGKRHVYSRRTFYIDEDTWAVVASDSYDQSGKIYRVGFIPSYPVWDKQTFVQGMNFYDMTKGSFLIGPVYSRPEDGAIVSDKFPADSSKWSPDRMAGSGIR
ncbi:DUF1329 domain-containing protein [Hydrocarboniphaga sp.]|uniref:DUF1329 domain-containing protein n=1 Tax=Hydrocarboniphaga sp. TaxID=2033016 RepID=UPI002601F93D|nr:DUF1329 domain-containing protein [Hydrocarboniphaga sp.]